MVGKTIKLYCLYESKLKILYLSLKNKTNIKFDPLYEKALKIMDLRIANPSKV